VNYLPEEVEFFPKLNPLDSRSGLSPIAPLRLSADMNHDALRYNRNTFRNGAIPDYLMIGEQDLTETQVQQFYDRWEKRFTGPDNAHRPAIASAIKDVKHLAFSNRDLEYLDSLKWSLADASRVFGVPLTMMSDLQFATLANMEALEIQYWRNTVLPQAKRIEDRVNRSFLRKLGLAGYQMHFDTSTVTVIQENEDVRIKRDSEYLDRGVVTINELRRERGMEDVP
jgi:HK97 family phage portal protein